MNRDDNKILRELVRKHYATGRYREIPQMAREVGITVTQENLRHIAKKMRDEGDGPRGARYVEAEIVKNYIRENTNKNSAEIADGLEKEHGIKRNFLSLAYLARQLGVKLERIPNGGRKRIKTKSSRRDTTYIAPATVRPDMPKHWGYKTRELCSAVSRRVDGVMGGVDK